MNSKDRPNRRWVLGAAVATLIVMTAASSKGNAANGPAVEPSALNLLQSATDYLRAQNSLAFTADVRFDDVQTSGLKYQLHAVAKYAVRRPGDLLVDYVGDRRSASFYSDGATFVFYDRGANVYGTAPATGDNDATLRAIFAKYDFTIPLDDIVSNDPGKALKSKLLRGYNLGPSFVGGVATHHLAFTQSDIDWQIWIDDGATPLIRELLITYKKLPGQPQYMATFRDWNFMPIDPSTFVFSPPNGAIHVDFVAVSSAK